MADDQVAAMAVFTEAFVEGIGASPHLAAHDWETFALVAEVGDGISKVTAYRYGAAGPPLPTKRPTGNHLFRDLRERMRGPGGEAWDVVLVRFRRDPPDLLLDFLSGADAEPWRVNRQNLDRFPEALRPRPEHFGEPHPG